MHEPIHESRQAAVTWVKTNTHNAVFTDYATKTTIRVDAANEAVLMLTQDAANGFYWTNLREI